MSLAAIGLAVGAPAAGAATTTPRAASAKAAVRRAVVSVAADTARASAKSPAASDTSMTMRGSAEGTVFRTLTVEGEDRIQFDFERPTLAPDVDPQTAPGLDWGSARDVLDRTTPDLAAPLLRASALECSPYPGKPWLTRFSTGAVARFRPEVTQVATWKLTIADAHGRAVRTFQGHGSPPEEIAWDGQMQDGSPVVPGLTYSYVLEATDRAGNHRHFVGEGFSVAACRLESPAGLSLLFQASALGADQPRASLARPDATAPAIVQESASWLNQAPWAARPVTATVTARSQDRADLLAASLARSLGPQLLGGPARLRAVGIAAADAPERGVVKITTAH
jgi:hypothetical protein